jgi:hypothetical protein
VAAPTRFNVQPHAGDQIKVLIGGDAKMYGFQPFRRYIQCLFFSWLKRWHGSSDAAGRAMVARLNDRQQGPFMHQTITLDM